MADNTSVLGQDPIDPTNVNKPELDNSGKSLTFDQIVNNLSTGIVAKTPVFPENISAKTFEKRLGEYSAFEGVNVPEAIAQEQSGAEQMAYLPARVASKALTEFLKIPGFVGGAIEWASEGFDPSKNGVS